MKEFFQTLHVTEKSKHTISIILKKKAHIISLNNLSKAFGIRNNRSKLGIVGEEKILRDMMKMNLKRKMFVDPSNSEKKRISSAKLKLVFQVMSKFYKSFLRCLTSSKDYVNSLEYCFLWHILEQN